MKGEIPVFRRCCVCVPLRYGLLAWGYFKMIADAFILLLMGYSFIETLMMIRLYGVENHASRVYSDMIVITIAITIFLTDLIVTIVFIIGGHKKNVKLMRVFYILSMGMWVSTLLLYVISVVQTTRNLMAYNRPYWGMILLSSCFYFVVLVVQSYFLLLLRSEIIKLRNSSEFRFVNNAAGAECTMTCEEKVGQEIVKEVVTN